MSDDIALTGSSEHEQPQLSLNPFLSVFTQPRKAIRYIQEHECEPGPFTLYLLATYAELTMQVLQKPPGLEIPIGVLVGSIAAMGFIIGFIAFKLFGFLYGTAGRWLGGSADHDAVRLAMSWSELPTFVVFIFWGIYLLLMKSASAQGLAVSHPIYILAQVLFWGSVAVMSVWGFIMICKMISEVQQFSFWKGMFSIALGNLLLVLPFVVMGVMLAIFVPGVTKSFRGGLPSQIPGQFFSTPNPSDNTQEGAPRPTYRADVNLAVQGGRLLLSDGRELFGKIMYEDNATVYVEVDGQLLNIAKSQIVSLEREG